MSLTPIALGAVALILVGLGYVLAVRTETALAFQRRYAEAVSSVKPSENPEYYEETDEHRKGVFQLGGTVILLVGVALFAMVVYGTVFVESSP